MRKNMRGRINHFKHTKGILPSMMLLGMIIFFGFFLIIFAVAFGFAYPTIFKVVIFLVVLIYIGYKYWEDREWAKIEKDREDVIEQYQDMIDRHKKRLDQDLEESQKYLDDL